MWSTRRLYRAVSKELSEYKFDLVGVQEGSWDRGTELADVIMNQVQFFLCIIESCAAERFYF
jgi:hypothetical protein